MKKFLSIAFISLIMTACSGEDPENSEGVANKVQYEGNSFSILMPTDWETIQPGDFTTNFPSQTQVAFRNNIKNEIYTANVNVTIRQIAEEVATADFAKSMQSNAKKSLLSYEESGNREEPVTYGEEELIGLVYEFTGKKSAIEPIVKFRELYIVHNNQGITATAAYLPNEDENVVNLANEMLDSLSLK